MTTPPMAPPQYSPDGRWWWNGQQWVPVQQPTPAPGQFPRPAPYGTYAAAAVPATDGLVVTGFIFSLVWVFGLTSIAAIVMGHTSRAKFRKAGENPPGLNTATIVLGWCGLVLGALAVVGAVSAVQSEERAERRAAVRADVHSLSMAEEMYAVDNNTYTADIYELGSELGANTPGVRVEIVSADEDSYCLKGYDVTGDGYTTYYDSATYRFTSTPCGGRFS